MKNDKRLATSAERAPLERSTSREDLGRREFLQAATLGTAAFLATSFGRSDTAFPHGIGASTRARYAVLRTLAPGDVRPEGWLRLYLQKQAQELGEHLPDVSWPFSGQYWSGEETPPEILGWWPWEQRAYWIDGALRCALTLRDEALRSRACSPLTYTLDHAQSDGYLGPVFARDAQQKPETYSNFRWPHTVLFRALAAYGEATRDPRVAESIRRHYLSDKTRTLYGGPSRNVTNIEAMLWAYERTGDAQLLELAESAWNAFVYSAPPGDRESGDLHPDRVFANTPIHAHGVTYIEKAKLPAILYQYTGDPNYLRFALAAQERIFSHHMLIDGIPSTTEDYHQTTALDGHETCDITDHTWSWGYLLMATGDGAWADRIERACFNAGMGAIKKDWKGVQYFSSPNQVIATHTSSHIRQHGWLGSKGSMAYRPNPGHEVACCGGNVHRLFPNYVIRMWMTDSKGGLTAVLYGASTVRAEVGPDLQSIEIDQETEYPFAEQIHFTIRSTKPITFPLSLRIPAWCKAPQLKLNDRALPLPPRLKGFVRLERAFEPGDRITLSLPMDIGLSYWPDQGLAFERGPLVYALSVTEEWTPTVAPKWSTADFPEWDARPTSAWNYGIGVDETEVLSQVHLNQKASRKDPWLDPPVSLTVPLTRIPGWRLQASADLPNELRTPSLPDPAGDVLTQRTENQQIERVELVPYGSTQLRLTIFPESNTKS